MKQAHEISMPSQNTSITAQSIRNRVLPMLDVIEDPNATDADRKRACSTIRDAFDAQDASRGYGVSLAEYEHRMSARDASTDRVAGELDSQEEAFARRLRQLMNDRSVTQAELAARVGCTQPAISQMLKRQCRPQRKTILRLAEALGVDARELWPDLDVTDILDTVAAAQQDQELSSAEAAAFRVTLQGPPSEAPAAPLPKRKRST